jgi:hypothetical protein
VLQSVPPRLAPYLLSKRLTLKKHIKVLNGEKDPAKAKRLMEVEAAKKELIRAKVEESTAACLAHYLFCKLLKDEPKTQRDCILTEMHTKNPWEDIKGARHNSLCGNCSNP